MWNSVRRITGSLMSMKGFVKSIRFCLFGMAACSAFEAGSKCESDAAAQGYAGSGRDADFAFQF